MSELVPIPGTVFLKTLDNSTKTQQRSQAPSTDAMNSVLAGMALVGLEIISRVRPEDALSSNAHSPVFRRYVRRIRTDPLSRARGLVTLESFHSSASDTDTYEVFGLATFAHQPLGFVGHFSLTPDPQILSLRVLE